MFKNFDSGTYVLDSSAVKGDGLNPLPSSSPIALATGSKGLIDGSGLKWFANTNITFATSSSASGAMSEASFTHAVNATTVGGGTVNVALNDAFDGYNSLIVNGTPPADSAHTYNKNGPATTEDGGREIVLPGEAFGNIQVSRKVFVPTNDSFARWLNIFTNTGTTTQTVRVDTSNNLGSDSNTAIVSSSNGNATAELTDNWVTTFQNYSGTTSSDVRLGHVLQGPGAPTPLSRISFANGDDNPTWGYNLTLAPGQTAIIMNFATGQASKAAAAAKAAELVNLPPNALQGMSALEIAQVVNFIKQNSLSISPTNATQTEGNSGIKAFTFTINRTGNTSGITDLKWTVTGSGANPANAADFDSGILPVGKVRFLAGETSKLISVNVRGDTTVEPDETFSVTMSPVTGGFTPVNIGTGTIVNDDGVAASRTVAIRNNTILGTVGNDKLLGTAGNDVLLGVDPLNGAGTGEVDRLTGGEGSDLFVLADSNNTYYLGNRISDYALITDFGTTDTIQTRIGSSLTIGGILPSDILGTALYLNTDLVAVVQGSVPTSASFVAV
jgi:RTX calcium-binding nonapeptide repeat (4 copies)